MATNEPLTPEKQLLKLIENPRQASVRVETAKREGKKWFSFPALKGRLDFWKGTSVKQWFSLKQFSRSAQGAERINIILRLLIVLMAIYTGYTIYGMAKGIKNAANLILPADKESSSGDILEPVVGLQSIAYYLEKIKGRNIFTPPQPELTQTEEKISEKFDESAEDPSKDCSLVGIAWSEDPEAMIEDTKLNRTFFMRRGQTLANGVRVVTIFKDKVILSYKGKEFELR